MPEEPFPPPGPGDQEPQGPGPLPAGRNGPQDYPSASGTGGSGAACPPPDGPGDGWDEPPADEPEGPQQGLFVCLSAENMELSRFGGDDQTPPMPPGPLLAMVAAAVAGGDGAGLAQVPEDMLFAMISGGRRMSSWATWLEFSAMRELALRHPPVPRRPRRARPAAPAAPGSPRAPAAPQAPAAGGGGAAGQSAAGDRPAPPDPAAAPDPAAGRAGGGAAGNGAVADTPAPALAPAPAPAGDGRVQFDDFVADEVSCDLRMSWHGAADRISYACDLAGRLPVTFAALGAGLIDPVHAKIIFEQTFFLSAADAAKADPLLAAAAQNKTYAELRAAAAKLVLTLDPEAAERRKQARRKNDAHVRPFREDSGNAGMTARELPSDEVLASWQHVEQRAGELRAAGMPGSLRELRWRAYLDLLQERDSRLTVTPAPGRDPGQRQGPADDDGPQDGPDGNGGPGGNGPGPHSPAGTGPDHRARPDSSARPAAKDPGPCLAALVNITVPLATALGQSGTPGEAGGFGLLDAGTARDLIAAAGRSPHTRWCVTVLHPDGTAAAHGCAAGRHPPPPGPEPPGPEPPGPQLPATGPPGTASPGSSCGTSGSPDQRPPPDTRARDYLLSLGVRLALIARGGCDHRHAETGYQPSRKLQHLIRTRSTRCSAPGCGLPAARCDLDHTLAWDKGGLTCECGLAPLCRHHHRCKQARGWQLSAGTGCPAMANPARTHLHHHPHRVPDVGGRTARLRARSATACRSQVGVGVADHLSCSDVK